MEIAGNETFGSLLRTFRKRRGLKQLALSHQIGKKNRASISNWERSLYRPEHPETVRALAHALSLSERETNQLLAAADFPAAFQIPESREGQDLEILQQRYFAWIQNQYEYMDMGGISPRVASRAGARTIKIRMEDIFIPLLAWKEGKLEDPDVDIVVPVPGGEEVYQLKSRVSLKEATDATSTTSDQYFSSAVLSLLDEYSTDGKEVITVTTEEVAEKIRQHYFHTPLPRVPLTIAKLLAHRRVVILGHPGTGKSTLGKYVAYALVSNNTSLLNDHLKGIIPLLVRAADYGKALKRDDGLSFYRYVTETYHSDHFGPLLAWALKYNRCLVIIDGLDEIPDLSWRGCVTRKIEQFVSEYYENRFVVTSRIVGYRENRLTGDFTHVQLAEWGEEQIVPYLEKWYQAGSEKASATIVAASRQKAQTLWKDIRARRGVRQLAGVPLLLMIIALVNQYGSRLPERRVEVYQLATETLLSHWPSHHREQQIDCDEMLQILDPIAYRMFTRSEDRLITEYEFRPLFEEQVRQVLGTDTRETRRRSAQLLRTIEEHTGFLLKRGINEHGQELYGFLHPTFAEYLTACYLAKRWEKEHVLEMADRIHESTWHEVVLLMAGHLGTLMPILATRLVEHIEKLPDPFEDQLHRNLLLVAEIIGDSVRVEHYKRDEVISGLIVLAQETAFEPLWRGIIARLSRIANVSPLARLPELLKQREKDIVAVRVRKVLLARALGFPRETDLASLVQGLFADVMTCELARASLNLEFRRGARKQRACRHTCYIRHTTARALSTAGGIELSKQAAEGLRNLSLPTQDDVETIDTAPPSTPAEIWIIDREQLLQLDSQRLATLLTTCAKHDLWRASILREEIRHAPNLRSLLQEWITQATATTTSEGRILALNALLQIFSSQGPREIAAPQKPEWDELPVWRTALQTMAGTDEDPQIRALALSVARSLLLGRKGHDLIMRGLSDQAPKVRAIAALEVRESLGRSGPHDESVSLMLSKLWELMADPSSEVRLACAKILLSASRAVLQTPEDLPRLSGLVDFFCALPLEHLTNRKADQYINDLMRLACQTNDPAAIDAIGNRLVVLIVGETGKELRGRIVQSGRLPPVAAQEQLARKLSPLLQHTEARIRRLTMVIWAAYFRDLPEASHIIPFLQDNDVRVRSAAFEALGNTDLAKPAVLDMLLHALRNDEPPVKLAILRRIGEDSRKNATSARSSFLHSALYRPEVVDGLLYALSDEAPRVAAEAASLLTRVQDPALREKIIEIVSSQAPENLAALSVLWSIFAPPVGVISGFLQK